MTPGRPRHIRSFARRQGRATQGQRRAWERGWPRFGLQGSGPLIPAQAFGRDAPLVLEIGFGMGQSLAAQAAANPGTNYLGIEVHRPGVGHLLRLIEEGAIANIRIYCEDAVAVLEDRIATAALDGVQIFFPDPWPKKRHRKRRLLQAPFLDLLAEKLRPGGFLHLATDWEDYAEQMLELLSSSSSFLNTAPEGGYCPRPLSRPPTRFEERGQRLGHKIWDLLFQRT